MSSGKFFKNKLCYEIRHKMCSGASNDNNDSLYTVWFQSSFFLLSEKNCLLIFSYGLVLVQSN